MEDLWKFDLRNGNSDHPSNGACVMDAVSWFKYGTLGDHPSCASPALTEFAIRANDLLPDSRRNELKPFIFRLMGSKDPDNEQVRVEYLAWRAVTVFAPLALDAVGLNDRARELREFDKSLKLKAAEAAARDAGAAWAARAAAWAAGASGEEGAAVYDTVIKTLDEALKLGKQGEEMDYLEAIAAVCRFEEIAALGA